MDHVPRPAPADSKPPAIGERLTALMAAKGLTQTTLATKSGIDRSDINRIVRGHRPPRLSELPLLAAVLGTEMDELLRGVDLNSELGKELAKVQEGTMRLLDAEAARDDALRQAEQLRAGMQAAGAMIDRERQAFADERLKLAGEWERERRALASACSDRVSTVERERAALDAQLATAKHDMFRRDMRIAELESTVESLREEVAGLRKGLADENSAKVLTGVISGLAGMVSGAVLAKLNEAGPPIYDAEGPDDDE